MENSTDTKYSASLLLHLISGLSIGDALSALSGRFPGKVTFSTSFGIEDQVIAHHILAPGLPVSIFTLDTGRLFAETYAVWSSTNEKYGAHIQAYYPSRDPLEINRLWDPKFNIRPHKRVVTFGSCFAQHIGRALRARL